MAGVSCPSCGAPLQPAGALQVCTGCLRSVVCDGDTARLATAGDTVGLSDRDLTTLRLSRAAARKAQGL